MSTLIVTAVEAKNLLAADRGGTSDPYCKLRVGSQNFKTKIVKKCLAPRWNETFTFKVSDPKSATLIIEVLDHDTFSSDDPLGSISIPLNKLERGVETTTWHNLSGVPKGQINLRLKAVDFGLEAGALGANKSESPIGYPSQASQIGGPPMMGGYPSQPPSSFPPPIGGGYGTQPVGGYPPNPYAPPPSMGGYPPNPYGYPPDPYNSGGYPPNPYGPPPGQYGSQLPPQQGAPYGSQLPPGPGGYPPQQGYPPQGGPPPGQYGSQLPPQQGAPYGSQLPPNAYPPA